MKHAGSRDELFGRISADGAEMPSRFALVRAARAQSRVSLVLCFGCVLLLIAIVADKPVRNLARSLDPSLVSVLRVVTEFGNSAWSIGIGLALLACVAVQSRGRAVVAPEALQSLRSTLLLLTGSVALSGFLASLAKNVIGRARPSTVPEADVLEFAVMSFRASWASFPSGHATTATACAVTLAICFPRSSWAWLSIGFLAALSRALLGVHWLSDCCAGMALGAVVTLGLRQRMVKSGHVFQPTPSALFRVIGATVVQFFRSICSAGRWIGARSMSLFRRRARPNSSKR
jgi:membrane-associated phospholipid phosphatase